MAIYIPHHCNAIIVAPTGSGFRTLAVPSLFYGQTIVIAPKALLENHYKRHNAVTPVGLAKLLESNKFNNFIKSIVIDCRLPRVGTKSFKALRRVCTGRQIVFVELPYDLQSLAAAMVLMSVTKNPACKTVPFNHFTFTRSRWTK